MPNLKVIRGQRVLNLGIVLRCGEEACINAKVIRGKELMHTQIQEFLVSGGTILDENFISGQIVNAHADSRFSLVSRGGVRLGVMSVPNKKCFGFLRPDQIVPKPFICLYYCNRLNKTYTSSYSRKLHSFRAIHRIISWEMCL